MVLLQIIIFRYNTKFLTVLPITIHLESSYLGANLSETCVTFKDAQLEITYTTATPSPIVPEITPLVLIVGLCTFSMVALIAKKGKISKL